jgi:hypothetical protein
MYIRKTSQASNEQEAGIAVLLRNVRTRVPEDSTLHNHRRRSLNSSVSV